MPVTQLVDDLWGERVPETAVKALQVYVSKLRKALPEGRLATRGSGYMLVVADGELDVELPSALPARDVRRSRAGIRRTRPLSSQRRWRSGAGRRSPSWTSRSRRPKPPGSRR